MQHLFHPTAKTILSELPSPRPQLVLAPSLEGMEVGLLSGVLPDWMMRIMVVSDAQTHAALAVRVEDQLASRYAIKRVVLQASPLPTHHLVMELLKASEICDAIVAVGSGTINDLCKQVSCLAGKPYVVFPTAPSMNGYTSANASIIVDGVKQSFAARLPALIACDMRVIAHAPVRLRRAGLGDSLARPTAQVDWLMSHLTRGTAYDVRPFEMLVTYEKTLFENAAALVAGDISAVTTLMEVLLLSGFGMTLAGGSYPASQGEHMIAHHYETLTGSHRRNANPVRSGHEEPYHGEQIGVTTLTMAALQQQLVGTLPTEVASRLRTVMLPAEYIESVLSAAGCPTTPAQLGWDEALYAKAVETAHTTRERYTFLNLRLGAATQP